jgi:queuosine precursor transporter
VNGTTGTVPRSQRARWAAAAFAIYAGAIILSNALIVHVGIPAGPGVHLTPVGFGLLAPSGVWASAVSFPARDVVQRTGGRWLGIAAIIIGAAVSFWVSDPHIALASGLTYLCSESLDMAVYTPLQKRWFVPAVLVSGCAAIVLDSVLFLHLAGLYSTAAVEGLILGKFWVILVAVPVTWGLRKSGPVAVPA